MDIIDRELSREFLASHGTKEVLVVKNIPEKVSEETAVWCIEVICNKEDVDKVYFHHTEDGRRIGNVALVFLEGKVQDFKSIIQRAEEKKLEKKQLKFYQLPSPDGLIIYGLPREVTATELEYYFDREKIIGDRNETKDDVHVYDQISSAIVYFENPSLALFTALKVRHKIKDKEFTVEPYYDLFHKDVIAALMKSEEAESDYETVIDRKDTTVHEYQSLKPEKLKEQLLPNYDMYQFGSSPTSSEKKSFSNEMYDGMRIEKPKLRGGKCKTFDEEDGMTPTRERNSRSSLRVLSADEDDDGYLMPIFNDVTGKEDPGYELAKHVPLNESHIYFEINSEQMAPTLPRSPRPSERIKCPSEYNECIELDETKLTLLRIKRFARDSTMCKIDLDFHNNKVVFSGNKDSVTNAKLQMYEILDKVHKVTKRIQNGQAAILISKLNEFRDMLRKERISAVYTIPTDDSLCCQAFSTKDAEKAAEFLLKKLDCIEISYNASHYKYINSSEWHDLTARLKKENKVDVTVMREKKVIIVCGMHKDCQVARGEIRKSLNKNAEASAEKIEIKGSKSACFHHSFKDEVMKLKSDIGKRNGTLMYNFIHKKLVLSIEMKGDTAIIADVKTAINQMIMSIWKGPVDLQRISSNKDDIGIMTRALESGRGKKFISDFEEKHKCGLDIKKTDGQGHHQLTPSRSSPVLQRKEKPDLQRRNTVADFGGARPKEPVHGEQGNSFVCSSQFGYIEVILKKGNIVDERANMLVNVVASGCEFASGVIPQQFLRKGGQEVKQDFAAAHRTPEGLRITTQTGHLSCDYICHIELPKGKQDRNVLSQSIRSCFKTCSLFGLASVALPAVGTGKLLGYPLDVVADCLVAEAKESGKYNSGLKKIKFIIYEKDHVEAFRSRIQGSSASGVARDTDHRDRFEVRSPQPREEPAHKPIASVSVSNISIELYAKSKSEGEKLRKTLSKDIKDTFLYEEKYSNPKLKFLHKDTWKKLTTAAKKYHVWLIQDSDKLIYKGEKDSVSKTRTECLEILLSDDKVQKPEQKVTVRRGSREWWIQKSLEKTTAPIYWKHFTEDEGLIDKAIDVAKKRILNKPGQLVPVDQDILQAIVDLVKNTWDTSKVGQGKDAQGLGHSNIVIKKVERIENFDLFDTYQTRKRSFYRKLAEEKRFSPLENITHQGTKLAQMGKIATRNISRKLTRDLDLFSYANESYFFHGTASGAVDNIIKKGLDEKYGGDNAMFGPGIYGAESSTKADQYADDKTSRQQKNRKMILMRLLLGNIYVTSQPERFNAPPCSNCLKPKCPNSKHEPFDSVVADGKWLFREFIVYRSNQCYPEYLITYDRV